MPLSFPTSSAVGGTYQSGSSATYAWDGTKWVIATPPVATLSTSTSASFVTGSNVKGAVESASFAGSRRPTGAFWTSFLTNPSAAGAYIAGTAVFDNNDNGIRLTTAGVAGSTGNILWNLTGSNAFDFLQDFRATFNVYYGATAGGFTSGDGFTFNFGSTNTGSQTFGRTDGTLSFRVETYQATSGSYIYLNNASPTSYNQIFTMGVAQISSAWNTWIIEVRTVPASGKRFGTLYWGSELWPQISADVTAWAPTGKVFTVGAWTGGATANQWCKTVKLEYI